jgi:hypothetical protein
LSHAEKKMESGSPTCLPRVPGAARSGALQTRLRAVALRRAKARGPRFAWHGTNRGRASAVHHFAALVLHRVRDTSRLLRCAAVPRLQERGHLGVVLGPMQRIAALGVDRRGEARNTKLSMPGDPNACREQAARCARLAAEMADPQIKAVLLDLARSWEELADKIEAANEIAGDLLRGRDPRP